MTQSTLGFNFFPNAKHLSILPGLSYDSSYQKGIDIVLLPVLLQLGDLEVRSQPKDQGFADWLIWRCWWLSNVVSWDHYCDSVTHLPLWSSMAIKSARTCLLHGISWIFPLRWFCENIGSVESVGWILWKLCAQPFLNPSCARQPELGQSKASRTCLNKGHVYLSGSKTQQDIIHAITRFWCWSLHQLQFMNLRSGSACCNFAKTQLHLDPFWHMLTGEKHERTRNPAFTFTFARRYVGALDALCKPRTLHTIRSFLVKLEWQKLNLKPWFNASCFIFKSHPNFPHEVHKRALHPTI